MSEEKQYAKKKSFLFQRFIAVARVMNDPELKTMRPREGETEGKSYCSFLAATGSPYGSNDDAVFNVSLLGKNAEMFCKEPRKGENFLFDLQLRTWNKDVAPGQKYGERVTSFVGNFSFLGARSREDQKQPEPKPDSNKSSSEEKNEEKAHDQIPF